MQLKVRNEPLERHHRMTTEPVTKLIPSLAIPTIISMLVTALYNMVDTYFVGRINTSATGAVGIVFSLMTIIQVIGMSLGVGSGSYVARLLGAKENERASRVMSISFFTALLLGLGLTIVGELFLSPLMRLMGSTDTILPYATAYAQYILLGAPYMAASFVMNVNLRSEGSAFLGMMGIASGAILNIALDPLFMFVFKMGIAGAAIATIFSQFVGFLILLSHYVQKRSTLRIQPFAMKLDRALYLEIVRSGLPTLFRQGAMSLATIVLNSAASSYGDAAVAGMSVVTRIIMFINSIMLGFGQGFQPVAAFNFTAGRKDRVYEAFWFSVRTGATFLSAFALIAGVFAPEIIRLFRNDPEVVRIGTFALRMQSVSLPLSAYIIISNMMFQYIGKPERAMVLALSRQGLVFIPSILLFSRLFGLTGIQISQAFADLVTFGLALGLTRSTLRSLVEQGREPQDRSLK
ncbi:MAG: MATE family efflux transporter [Spirochaetes bacterium]|nr:MATE family efflux transporter [Spirochaetota bacterium]